MAASFAPQLIIPHNVHDIGFYSAGLGAEELARWSNNDGSVHVAELSIDGALFHLHEEGSGTVTPGKKNTTIIVGLFVENVDAVVDHAVAAGAELVSPARDYDYAYRQAQFKDPFGHIWLIEKRSKAICKEQK